MQEVESLQDWPDRCRDIAIQTFGRFNLSALLRYFQRLWVSDNMMMNGDAN
jgi:hypothetical protein